MAVKASHRSRPLAGSLRVSHSCQPVPPQETVGQRSPFLVNLAEEARGNYARNRTTDAVVSDRPFRTKSLCWFSNGDWRANCKFGGDNPIHKINRSNQRWFREHYWLGVSHEGFKRRRDLRAAEEAAGSGSARQSRAPLASEEHDQLSRAAWGDLALERSDCTKV